MSKESKRPQIQLAKERAAKILVELSSTQQKQLGLVDMFVSFAKFTINDPKYQTQQFKKKFLQKNQLRILQQFCYMNNYELTEYEDFIILFSGWLQKDQIKFPINVVEQKPANSQPRSGQVTQIQQKPQPQQPQQKIQPNKPQSQPNLTLHFKKPENENQKVFKIENNSKQIPNKQFDSSRIRQQRIRQQNAPYQPPQIQKNQKLETPSQLQKQIPSTPSHMGQQGMYQQNVTQSNQKMIDESQQRRLYQQSQQQIHQQQQMQQQKRSYIETPHQNRQTTPTQHNNIKRGTSPVNQKSSSNSGSLAPNKVPNQSKSPTNQLGQPKPYYVNQYSRQKQINQIIKKISECFEYPEKRGKPYAELKLQLQQLKALEEKQHNADRNHSNTSRRI